MRVLLVEDDTATARSIELALASEGIVCDVANLGEEGLEIGKIYDYDIIILDLMLPDIDGYELTKQIRIHEYESGKRSFIVGLTGHVDVQKKQQGIDAGMDLVLIKPLTQELAKEILKSCNANHFLVQRCFQSVQS